jgi:hypothetical protein
LGKSTRQQLQAPEAPQPLASRTSAPYYKGQNVPDTPTKKLGKETLEKKVGKK